MSAGGKIAYTSIQASPRRPWNACRFCSVATRSIVATTATVGTTTRPRAQSRWRAHQYTTVAAPQNPAPMNAALAGIAMVHEKNCAVWSASTTSWVPTTRRRGR